MRWTLPLLAIALNGGFAASSLHGLAMPAHAVLPAAGLPLPAAAHLWPGMLLGTPDSPGVRAWRSLARKGRESLARAILP
ncbi:hypothetical protein [Belnapia sp. F-4-1]|uniref:hypothetical protein n=1 Tax=Belnapia sp. F-4-1 TaxID=1545443 RepID=UPI0005B92174|nr:hypothetical protein [Belnapia sp. F-4-1]